MTETQKETWQKIEHFEIDDINSSFTFTDRLARENDWSLDYSLRVVLEYKKFIFLISIADFALTPSDQVDQAWHLHLLYTVSYWEDLCENTIKRKIHHGPTKGKEEKLSFKDNYLKTLEYYSVIFGEKPPRDIWEDSEKRFRQLKFTRVNRHENWVIPKRITKKR